MIRYMKEHPQVLRRLILGFAVFFGCFNFPIIRKFSVFDFLRLYTLLSSCAAVGGGLAVVYGMGQFKKVWFETIIFTAFGLVCRYFLEFGEVSNTYNFTPANIVSFLVLIPLGTALAYLAAARVKKEFE